MRLRRKRRCFTATESAEIWDRWRKGQGLKFIGRAFGRGSSSIFNHLQPSGGIQPPPRRRSWLALSMAEREEISRSLVHGPSLRPKPSNLVTHPHLRRIVDAQLRHTWSPQQIAGWLKSNHPEDEALRVSHETIYRTLFVQTRGALK